jgi:XTP/dITP diphosphohydrolase
MAVRKLSGRELVVATHNAGKVREIGKLIAPYGLTARSASELGLDEPEETGVTFEENAYIKAHAAAVATGLPALADDSGLCVASLDGAPGVYTADWAEQADGSRDFQMAMQKVEDKLVDCGANTAEKKGAMFVATLCLCWPDGHAEYFRGEVHGQLIWPPTGTQGFGYDPVFLPDGQERTFGQMSADEKHGHTPGGDAPLSHRSRAFVLFAEACLNNDD